MSEEFEQLPFECVEFAENPEPRCACVLLLDTSGSMAGKPIEQLNEDREAYLKKGLELWPSDKAEDWLDEVGYHRFMGETKCVEEDRKKK